MYVIPPITITDSNLLYSSIAEPDIAGGVWVSGTPYSIGDSRYVLATKKIYVCILAVTDTISPELDTVHWVESRNLETEWNAGTSYAIGDLVLRTTTHKIYENLVAGVNANLPENDTDRWLEVSNSNKWSSLNTDRNDMSVGVSSIQVKIAPGQNRCTSIAVLGVQGAALNISVYSVMMNGGATPVQSTDYVLTSRSVTNWLDYFFKKFLFGNNIVKFDLPNPSDAVIWITVTGLGSNPVTLGSIVVGTGVYIGAVQYSPRSDSTNYSRIDRDAFGSVTLVPRRSVPKTSQTLLLDRTLVRDALDVREELNAVPAVWSGLDEDITDPFYEPLLVLGIYKQFEIELSNPIVVTITLELEEY